MFNQAKISNALVGSCVSSISVTHEEDAGNVQRSVCVSLELPIKIGEDATIQVIQIYLTWDRELTHVQKFLDANGYDFPIHDVTNYTRGFDGDYQRLVPVQKDHPIVLS